MDKVDSFGERALVSVCHSIFRLRLVAELFPRWLEGKTEQMLTAAALTSQQNLLTPLPRPGRTWAQTWPQPCCRCSSRAAQAQAKNLNYPTLSDKKLFFLHLSKMPVQTNRSQSALHHDNGVLPAVLDAPLSCFQIVFGFERRPLMPRTSRTVDT